MANPMNRGNIGGAPVPPTGGVPTNNAAMQNIANMVRSFKGMNNPQQIMQMLGQRNPQAMQQVQQLMQSGKSPKDLASSMLKQRGIDPEQLMNMINNG